MLARGAVVFDRYSLVLLPGLLFLVALGVDRALARMVGGTRTARWVSTAAITVIVSSTIAQLAHTEMRAGENDVDVLARRWVLAHVERGASVAVYDESNAFLPRSAKQLQDCFNGVATPAAYRAKWQSEGLAGPTDATEPMRNAVMADEAFRAFWCRREQQARQDGGYSVIDYHPGPRPLAREEADVIAEFRDRTTTRVGGVDVLIMNRPVAVGIEPVEILYTRRGQRVIYRR
jgi:hypothetical protein